MDVTEAYQQVRQHLGRTYERELGELRGRDLERFGVAVGGELPADQAATVPATPPLYLSSVMGWDAGPNEEELRPDGAAREQLADVPVEGLRLMGAGQDLQFHQPIVAGARLVQRTRVEDVQLKDGRSAPFLLLRLERTFLDDGQPVLRCLETFIGR